MNRPPTNARRLTLRQAQILRLVALGLTNGEIGKRMYLSEDTVKSHLWRLFKAMGARSRAHAIAMLLAPHGFLPIHPDRPTLAAAPPPDGAPGLVRAAAVGA